MDALRAEVARLQELVAVKDQLLTSKDAQLAMKDELLAAKDQLLLASKGAAAPTAEEPQQYKGSDQHSDERAKRPRLQSSSSFERAAPLDKDEVLDQVFSYVGGGDHLYVGGVSRRWKGKYLRHCVLHSTSEHDQKLVTRHRSAVLTEGRLKLALASGLSVKEWDMGRTDYAELICKRSTEPQQVIALLRVHGVPWDASLCNYVALYAKLQLLQWLRSSSCPWIESGVLCSASRSGNVAMLEWLLAVTTTPWTGTLLSDMLDRAAWFNKLAAAQSLRARGAACPPKFFAGQSHADTDHSVNHCWSLSTVWWAIACGSGWLDWHCEDYAADGFIRSRAKRHARAVLKWAHANGCPCTCGHQQQQQQQQ
jgi:hypothetical protein